ncbi:C type lectin containing domain protein [Penaeus vannamei]|uniref:C type lectin containing domain protein n=1 Tax=Penaeus vannamei TaxID=6689 RepID=A0A423U238_PENVA|nr:uncharacterized protein LOC113800420 [Penaeus vannamei]ROT82765.1 C type lectin containing domain protein [Penaeus vannamei]
MVVIKVLLAALLCICQVAATCPESEQIHCRTSDRCTRIRYICDGDNDCGDYSDEESGICSAWRNEYCERGSVRCRRMGDTNCVTISRYCEISDPPCEGDLDMRLCQMLREEKLRPLEEIVLPTEEAAVRRSSVEEAEILGEEFLEKVNVTVRHPDCPQFYTRVGDRCLSVFFFGKVNWGEARSFCKTIGGDLLTLHDGAEKFHELVRHLREHHIESDFWVGGNLRNETAGWTWIDGTPMELGTPFWTLRSSTDCQSRTYSVGVNSTRVANEGACYHYQQAPHTPAEGHCAALNFENFFYMSDEKCLELKSPLCVFPKKV